MKTLRALLGAAAVASLAFASSASASQPPPPLPNTPPGSKAILLGVDSVRRQLHLTSLQRAVLNDIRNEYREEARAIVAKAGADAASKKAAQKKLEALTATYNRRALRALNDDQRARLVQIEYQILGAYMLLSADVRRELALTPKQEAKLAYVWWRAQLTASAINRKFEEGKISHDRRLIELRDNRLDRSDDMIERLTKQQRAKLDQLAGGKLAS
ncbi:MAG: hypothetical protein PHC88_16170 [Terrimicrobiaceae bacterium]|nr:hypothetical protein [Terrimicrobiaceae bacterium]